MKSLLTIICALVVFIASSGLCASSEITAIILPLSSTVWVPGKQGKITYRVSGKPSGQAYEIDLVSGDPDNAQLVHVFENSAVPTSEGVNSVTVDIPKSIAQGQYGVRLGSPDGESWKYSQLFSISNSATASENPSTSHESTSKQSSKVASEKKPTDKNESEGMTSESDGSDESLHNDESLRNDAFARNGSRSVPVLVLLAVLAAAASASL